VESPAGEATAGLAERITRADSLTSNTMRSVIGRWKMPRTGKELVEHLISRIIALEEDIENFGPAGDDLARLSKLRAELKAVKGE
jgi:hypothetical protein